MCPNKGVGQGNALKYHPKCPQYFFFFEKIMFPPWNHLSIKTRPRGLSFLPEIRGRQTLPRKEKKKVNIQL